MSIPGTNHEDGQPTIDIDPAQAAAAEAAAREAQESDDEDPVIETVTVGTQKMASVADIIKHRKEAKAAKKEAADLRARVERAEAVGAQLNDVMPMIEQLRNITPQQREMLAAGKLPSPEGTRQPTEDSEAIQWAEMQGFIAADGSLDVRRARQNLDWLDERQSRRTQAEIAPLRQNTAQQQAAVLRERAKAVTDTAGHPLATKESIDEAYGMLPAELAMQPNVAMVAIGTAMLIDRMKNRRVTAAPAAADTSYAAPIYSEPGGRRGAPTITAEERAALPKLGLTEKDYTEASTALSRAAGGRRGIALE